MTTALVQSLVYLDNGQLKIVPDAKKAVKKAVLAFLDMSSTATGQKTHYNKRSEQIAAMEDIHNAVFEVNRGLYLAMLALPGVLDISIQQGITRLLGDKNGASLLSSNEEAELIKILSGRLKADRLLKMLGMICDQKINRRSVRTFILVSVLAHRNLPWWAVKYRRHLLKALKHAWGSKYAMVVARVLAGGIDNATARDAALVRKLVDRYAVHSSCPKSDIYESICYVFGKDIPFKNDVLKARVAARDDLSAGKVLPKEVLEGIRGRFHKRVSKDRILELTKDTMTDKQKLRSQRSAKKAEVEMKFDASKLDAVSLYVHALEEGMDEDSRAALDEKASRVASGFPLRYQKASIVLDTSLSMSGTDHNKNRPLAISLAMKDVLVEASDSSEVFCTEGELDRKGLIKASGDTSLAKAVAKAFMTEPDVVFLITDGYENAPAGRVHEVISAARRLGIETPVYQFSPVMASEAAGIRSLSDHVSALPVSTPEGIGLSLIRVAIEQDTERGLQALLNATVPRLSA